MELGEKIARRRRELGMSAEQLAAEVFVTATVENTWERGELRPDRQSLVRLADALQLPITEFITAHDAPDWTTRDQMFSDIHMYTRMRTLAQAENLPNTYKALAYARDMHQGENRKPSKFNNNSPAVPYIVHPLMMACHAHALGIRGDSVLATVMLHDVCEDCGISPEELPFPQDIRHSVALLTKHEGQPRHWTAATTCPRWHSASPGRNWSSTRRRRSSTSIPCSSTSRTSTLSTTMRSL